MKKISPNRRFGLYAKWGIIYNRPIKDSYYNSRTKLHTNDLEYTAENCHAKLRKGCLAAFSLNENKEKHLALVAEIRKNVKKSELLKIVESISRRISLVHGINVSKIVLIKAKTISKTTIGKIQRKMCKLNLLNEKLRIIYYWKQNALQDSAITLSEQNKKAEQKLHT